MRSTNRLGLLVTIVSALAVLAIFGAVSAIRALLSPQAPAADNPSASPAAEQKLLSATDSDNDGLVDDLEIIYQTNPQQADSDQDGTADGEEVTLLRDPINPGPDDGLTGLTAEGVADKNTYTGRYLALLPAGITRDQILAQERLEAFVEEERQPLLPEVPLSSVQSTDATGKAAIETYLDGISSAHNSALKPVSSDDIAQAFIVSGQNQPTQLTAIGKSLENNLIILRDIAAPAEVRELHRTLLAASEALLNNVKLLQNMKNDFVGGLVGAKNIEELGPVFNNIAKQITALEAKYGLK